MTADKQLLELDDLEGSGVITAKERQVLTLTNTMSDRAIATALRISRGAVRDRRKNALRKIALHRNEAA